MDDESAVRRVVVRTLSKVGLDVLTAADGQEAMRLFEAHRADISAVVLDLSMPAMDGAELTRVFLAADPELPIVLTSGHVREDVRSRVDMDILAGFLKKPFSPQEMVDVVRQAVER